MGAEAYIHAVKTAQAAIALESLLKPRDRDSFEYGLQSGLVQGLQKALEILEKLQDEAAGVEKPAAGAGRPRNPYTQDLDGLSVIP